MCDLSIRDILEQIGRGQIRIPAFQRGFVWDSDRVAYLMDSIFKKYRQGVELDTLQLLSAWTWSEEFQLQDQFAELADELAPFGFEDVGGDTNLLLRCCSAILKQDASPQALMTINGADVRNSFDRVVNGVKYAVDYLRQHFRAEKLNNLPFPTLLVPLSTFFAVPGTQQITASD